MIGNSYNSLEEEKIINGYLFDLGLNNNNIEILDDFDNELNVNNISEEEEYSPKEDIKNNLKEDGLILDDDYKNDIKNLEEDLLCSNEEKMDIEEL